MASPRAFPTDEPTRFQLPGLNLPLNWTPHAPYHYVKHEAGQEMKVLQVPSQGGGKNLLRTALSDADIHGGWTSLSLTTLREFTMLQIMNTLTDKPGWEEKVFDDTIAEKWKTEATATPGRDVSQAMVEWIIEELRWKVESFKKTGTVTVYNGDVVKSDTAVTLSTKQALQAEARKLEDIPTIYKDYHPGSDNQVLDLVHPSLFPLVYGQSRVLEDRLIGLDDAIPNCGNGIIVPVRDDAETLLDWKGGMPQGWNYQVGTHPYSKDFQWLPCEVDISTGKAKITSYINNLHPNKHPELYSIIETVISKSIPLWNMTLSALEHKLRSSWRMQYSVEYDPDPEEMDDADKPPREEDEDEDEYYERLEEWGDSVRKVVQPEPGDFAPPEAEEESVDLVRDYAQRGLQVIVKLANIELTPDKPNYAGGSWHVEGQLNEHICATSLYYYDNSNIQPSQLAFRQQSSMDDASDMGYPQGQHDWLTEVFGCSNQEAAVQEVGSVTCSEGRLLTFPNILQHQVQPFSLEDPAKPGHRKILALFLVDPGIRIISTANVPPQQKNWWSEEVETQTASSGKALGKLSAELKEKVFQEVEDFPMSMERAKELRLKLMEERKAYVVDQGHKFAYNTFSLCEH